MGRLSNEKFIEQVLTRLHDGKVGKQHRKQAVILAGFARCLFEKGLADTSYGAVSKYAGLEPQHIAYYFPTWDSMLDGCFRYVIATAQEITVQTVATAKSPVDKLRALCTAPFTHLQKFPDHAAVLAAFQLECARANTYRSTHRKIRKQGQDRIAQILLAISPKLSSAQSEELAIAIQALVVGCVTEWVNGRHSESAALARQRTWRAVQKLLPSTESSRA